MIDIYKTWTYFEINEYQKIRDCFTDDIEYLSQYPYNTAKERIGGIRKKRSIELRRPNKETTIVTYYLNDGRKIVVEYRYSSFIVIRGILENGYCKYSVYRNDKGKEWGG